MGDEEMAEEPKRKAPPWLAPVAIDVFLAAVDQEADAVIDGLDRIADEGGPAAMYGACVAWAECVSKMAGFRDALASGAAHGVALQPLGGGPVVEDSAGVWAGRFVVAVINRKYDDADELFLQSAKRVEQGAAGAERHQQDVLELLSMAASIGRAKRAQRRQAAAVAVVHRPRRPAQRPRPKAHRRR